MGKVINESSLLQLFEERGELYDEFTDNIVAELYESLIGIDRYAIEDGMLDADDATIDVLAINYDSDDEMVTIVSLIKPNIGVTVMSDTGELFEVTDDEDRTQFSKMMRVNLPFTIVEHNDADLVFKFIESTVAQESITDQDEFEAMRDFVENVSDEDDYETLKGKAKAVIHSLDEKRKTSSVDNLSESDKKDDELLQKILNGATNPSGFFN